MKYNQSVKTAFAIQEVTSGQFLHTDNGSIRWAELSTTVWHSLDQSDAESRVKEIRRHTGRNLELFELFSIDKNGLQYMKQLMIDEECLASAIGATEESDISDDYAIGLFKTMIIAGSIEQVKAIGSDPVDVVH